MRVEPPRTQLPRRAPEQRLTAPAGRSGASRGRRARRPSWLWRYRRLLFLLGFLVFVAVAGFAWLLLQSPLPPATVQGQTTFLTDASGARLATFDEGHNRIPVTLNRVPHVVVRAILDTEDHGYYQHGALDPVGIVRAAVDDLRGKSLQGGSTIAQQYVKNVYVGSQRTFLRKIKEAAIAVKLERTLSKDQILERYLNTIYFGRGAYGIEAASQEYFGKDVWQIGLREGAYLAGLIRSPDTADATVHPRVADQRRNITLDEMVRYGDITRIQRDQIENDPVQGYVIDPHAQPPSVVGGDIGTQYFVDYVRRVLIAHFGLAAVQAGGMRVQTTLDPGLQAKAYDAVYGFLKPWEPSGALVSVDSNGDVRAMVGGRDWAKSQVNLATGREGGGAGRQAGSTFKPFLLAETVHEGYSLLSAFNAPAQIVFPKANNGADYQVRNYEGESYPGEINLVRATADSVNTVYAQLEMRIGVDKLAAMAHACGITSPLERQPSLVLGTSDVSPLEMAGAFSTFANDGFRVPTRVVTQVTTSDGRLLWNNAPARTRVLTHSDVTQVDFALKHVVDYGTGTGAAIPNRQIAGKTGTTENYGDAWFVGYTPNITTAVWMGWPDGSSHQMLNVRGQKVSGGTYPATMFNRYMTAALGNSDSGTFPTLTSYPGRSVTGHWAAWNPTGPPASAPTTSGSSSSGSSSSGSSSSGSGGSGRTTTTTAAGSGAAPASSTTSTTSGSSSGSSSSTTTPSSTTTTAPKSTTTTAPLGRAPP